MQESDFLYGSRSGIQKAIRRGDLNLCKTCFEILWADKAQRQWLKWRTPVLVAEEAWYFAGEFAEFMATNPDDDEKAWRRFLYRLCLIPKNKDAHGLWECATHDLPFEFEESLDDLTHKERMVMVQLVDKAGDNPLSVLRDAFEEFDKLVNFSDYEKAGMQQLISRAFAGGMISDKWFMLTSLVLFASRPVDKFIIQQIEAESVELWKDTNGGRKPKQVNLPWYIFDMHTQIGKIALGTFMKHKAKEFRIKEKQHIDDIWFYLESAYVPPELVQKWTGDERDEHKFYRPFWWPVNVQNLLDQIPGLGDYRKIKKQWPKMRKELEGIVNWLIEKRDS